VATCATPFLVARYVHSGEPKKIQHAAATGEGGCTGKANADGTVTWDCEGTVTLAK